MLKRTTFSIKILLNNFNYLDITKGVWLIKIDLSPTKFHIMLTKSFKICFLLILSGPEIQQRLHYFFPFSFIGIGKTCGRVRYGPSGTVLH